MKRRGFLAALGGAALDPERLLWIPGRKLISIPRPRVETVAGSSRIHGRVFVHSLKYQDALNRILSLQCELIASRRVEAQYRSGVLVPRSYDFFWP
jgi:hypothetical protein